MARSRFQFSIRSMMAIVAAVGLSLAAIVTKPGWASGALLLFMLTAIPTSAIVGILHGRGYLRAFCVGLLAPSSFGLWSAGEYARHFVKWTNGRTIKAKDIMRFLEAATQIHYRGPAAVLWCLGIAVGLSCIAFYWLISDNAADEG